jgi:hypothetical protein
MSSPVSLNPNSPPRTQTACRPRRRSGCDPHRAWASGRDRRPRRFGSPRELMSYLWLTPIEYSSGTQQHRGQITQTRPDDLGHLGLDQPVHHAEPDSDAQRQQSPQRRPARRAPTESAQKRSSKTFPAKPACVSIPFQRLRGCDDLRPDTFSIAAPPALPDLGLISPNVPNRDVGGRFRWPSSSAELECLPIDHGERALTRAVSRGACGDLRTGPREVSE